MIDPKIAGRVALVTGANNPEGIGAAIARALAMQGVRVFVTGRPQGEDGIQGELPEQGDERYGRLWARSLDDLVTELKETGAEVDGEEWDLSVPDAAGNLLEMVERRLGPVSLLVNNAAHWSGDTFVPKGLPTGLPQGSSGGPEGGRVSAEGHDLHFAVNSRAPALLMAEFARRHVDREAGGDGSSTSARTPRAVMPAPSELRPGALDHGPGPVCRRRPRHAGLSWLRWPASRRCPKAPDRAPARPVDGSGAGERATTKVEVIMQAQVPRVHRGLIWQAPIARDG